MHRLYVLQCPDLHVDLGHYIWWYFRYNGLTANTSDRASGEDSQRKLRAGRSVKPSNMQTITRHC